VQHWTGHRVYEYSVEEQKPKGPADDNSNENESQVCFGIHLSNQFPR
jgi:hypothetical protein